MLAGLGVSLRNDSLECESHQDVCLHLQLCRGALALPVQVWGVLPRAALNSGAHFKIHLWMCPAGSAWRCHITRGCAQLVLQHPSTPCHHVLWQCGCPCGSQWVSSSGNGGQIPGVKCQNLCLHWQTQRALFLLFFKE